MVGFLLYANTLFHGFTQDDAIVIYDNDFTKQGLKGIPGILSKDTFFGFFGQQKDLVAGGRYRPLSLVMFAFEYQLFGESPFIGHFVNILLYGFTGILLYLLFMKMLNPEEKKEDIFPWFLGLSATLIFIAHPIHTEAVANIKGRDEILALLGSLGATYYLLRAFHEGKTTHLIGAGVLFFLGLLAKENTITFLAVIPLVLFYFTKSGTGEIIKLMSPIVASTILFLAIRTSILGFDMGSEAQELMNNPFVGMSLGTKMATIIFTLGKYVQLLFVPIVLTHDYYPHHIPKMSWGSWQVLLSVLLYLGMVVFALLNLRKKNYIAFGISFFIITLSIVSNIVFAIGTNMSERFMYMPSVGFAFVVGVLLYQLGKMLSKKETLSLQELKIPLAVLGVVCLLFGAKTIHRNQAWESNYKLFTTDIKTSKNSAKLRNAVGGEIVAEALKVKNAALKKLPKAKSPQRKAQEEKINNDFKQTVATSVEHLNEAARLHPTYANVYLQLGNANNYLQNYDKAFGFYEKSLSYKENSKEALNNMGITYKDAAINIGSKNQQARYSTALTYFQKSIKNFERLLTVTREQEPVKKQMATTYREWGKFYGERMGRFDDALGMLKKSQEIDTENDETYRLMGLCYASTGKLNDAIKLFNELITKQPDNANLYFNLGAFYDQLGNKQKAGELRQKAIQMDPTLGQ